VGFSEECGLLRRPDDEEKALRKVLDMLSARTEHDFSKYKRSTVLRHLWPPMQRMQKAGEVQLHQGRARLCLLKVGSSS
jgi:hypothetical protein